MEIVGSPIRQNNDTCKKCGAKGHWARMCRKPKRMENGQQGDKYFTKQNKHHLTSTKDLIPETVVESQHDSQQELKHLAHLMLCAPA